jgi:Pyridoxamine 5'-phosphate oxidase
MSGDDPAAQTVRDIIEASRYLVLATADTSGRPWSSPVYFAHIGFTEFYWVSSPEATHSVNIAVRPEVGIVVFDSQAAIGAGQGVYMSAAATLLEGDEAARGIVAFSARSVAHGAREWTSQDVRPGAGLRLYRPPPTRTRSWPRTAGPTIAFPCRSAIPPSRDSARHQTTASQGRSLRPGGDWSGRRRERTRPVRLGQERGSYRGRGSGRRTRLRAEAQALARSDSRNRESAPIRQQSPLPRNHRNSMPCSYATQCVVLRS